MNFIEITCGALGARRDPFTKGASDFLIQADKKPDNFAGGDGRREGRLPGADGGELIGVVSESSVDVGGSATRDAGDEDRFANGGVAIGGEEPFI